MGTNALKQNKTLMTKRRKKKIFFSRIHFTSSQGFVVDHYRMMTHDVRTCARMVPLIAHVPVDVFRAFSSSKTMEYKPWVKGSRCQLSSLVVYSALSDRGEKASRDLCEKSPDLPEFHIILAKMYDFC